MGLVAGTLINELIGLLSAGLVLNLRKKRFLFTVLEQAWLHKSACSERNQQILSLLYLNSFTW